VVLKKVLGLVSHSGGHIFKSTALKTLLFNIVLFAFVSSASAQLASQSENKLIRLLQTTEWIVGISGTVIDDDAKQFKNVFDVKNTWDFLYFPSKTNLEGYIGEGFSVEGSFTYSRLKSGKLTGDNNAKRLSSAALIAFDLNGKYDLNQLFGDTKIFDPYAVAGFGYTYRAVIERKSSVTANIGFGCNIWIYKGFGANVQSHAKFALNNAFGKNYLQHSLGVVYRFNFLNSDRKTRGAKSEGRKRRAPKPL